MFEIVAARRPFQDFIAHFNNAFIANIPNGRVQIVMRIHGQGFAYSRNKRKQCVAWLDRKGTIPGAHGSLCISGSGQACQTRLHKSTLLSGVRHVGVFVIYTVKYRIVTGEVHFVLKIIQVIGI
ncbi:hypothetical protein D3C76_1304750 [compost metagenome]